MNRRSALLASGVALSTVVTGCLSEDDASDSSSQCRLQHMVEDSSEETDAPEETYRYEDLSEEAGQVFDEALANNGFYTTTNQSLRAKEF